MAKRFKASVKGLLDGRDYRADIYDAQYTGTTVTEVVGAEGFVYMRVGEPRDVALRPVKPREIQLPFIQTSDMSMLADRAEDEVRAEVVRTSSGNTVGKFFLSPNAFADRPLAPSPDRVTLQGTEGLPTLQQNSFGDLSLSSEEKVAPMRAIRLILNQLYSTDLPIEVGGNWYPVNNGLLGRSDLPLQRVYFDPQNYREDRSIDYGDWWTQYEVLRDLLKFYGCTLQQTFRGGEMRWHMRQRPEFDSTGSIQLWVVQPGGSTTHKGSTDLSTSITSLTTSGRVRSDHSRDPMRRREKVKVVQDHAPAENYLEEGGFENAATRWTILNSSRVATGLHSGTSRTPSETANNKRYLLIDYDSDGASGNNEYMIEQTVQIKRPAADAALRIQFSSWIAKEAHARLKLINGSNYLTDRTSIIRSNPDKGEVELPVRPTKAPIPEGAVLPIHEAADPTPEGNKYLATFKVSARAPKGAEIVRGELSTGLPSGTHYLRYLGFKSSDSTVRASAFFRPGTLEKWTGTELYLPFQTATQDRLPKDELTLKLGFYKEDLGLGVLSWLLDDVRIQPVRGGRALGQTLSEATVSTAGKTDDLTHRLGSGPTTENVAHTLGEKEYTATYSVADTGQDAQGDYWVEIPGDQSSRFSAGDAFDIFGSSANNGTYEITAVTYLSTPDETRLEIEGTVDTSVSDGTLGQYPITRYDGFKWGIGPSPSPTYPITELHARRRLRYFRGPNDKFEIRVLVKGGSPDLHGHEIVELNNTNYTISALEADPTTGETALTLLEHNDYGTS